MWKDRQVTGFHSISFLKDFFSMSDNKDVSGTGGGGDGVGAAGAERVARASAERQARAARRGADGAAPRDDSGSNDENDDVELISL